jgi:DNA-binding CsgD family transcriptional regulator/tetratricopeptide (TPR) repeat protein
VSPLVGRIQERIAIEQELGISLGGSVRVVSVVGEAGIGKTRLLESAIEAATERGFGAVMVAADEELRGPFFLLRTLFASTSLEALADQTGSRPALDEARDVLWGRERGREGLTPPEQVLRVYDAAVLAIRSIAVERPVALLFDDVQWADEDSLKLIRYLVRTSAVSPIVLILALRPETAPGVTAAASLLADLERMRLARRLSLGRFSRTETKEFLEHLLSGPVSADCVALLHERGEGVPFFIEEFVRSYREAGMLRVVEGSWKLSLGPRANLPASVQILIERRLGQLPAETRTALADAAVIGRRFRLADLAAVSASLGAPTGELDLADLLAPATNAILLAELPEGAAHDYAFTHDEIRSVLVGSQQRQRRRRIHAALVDLLRSRGEPSAETLPALAYHALQAGDAEGGVAYSIRAARVALDVHGAEEAIRTVDAAREAASSPADRAELLRLRDEALAALKRGRDRMATLAELAALASALGNPELELDVTLRRASAARQAKDHEQAADFARRALAAAEDRGDRRRALAAQLELGQALLTAELGESFSPPPSEIDMDPPGEAFQRALELAEDLGDEWAAAAARRELAVVELGKAKRRFLEILPGIADMIVVVPGLLEDPDLHLKNEPAIKEHFEAARAHAQAAVETFERLGDRRALTSSLVALAYANVVEDTQHGHVGRIEQIRRLHLRLQRMVSESERTDSELHMLYSIHVYARTHAYPDLALSRGAETYELARDTGDRRFEFLAAGGMALTHIDMDEVAEAEAWLDRAAAAALETPGPLPARQLETWHGLLRSAAGDPQGMTAHLERALEMAAGSPAGRCELLGYLSLHSALHGIDRADDELMEAAVRRAEETIRVADSLPGDLVWEARALAALGLVALARDDEEQAVRQAETAVELVDRTRHVYPLVYPDLLLALARILTGREGDVATRFRWEARDGLVDAIRGTRDADARARWFRARLQRELSGLLGLTPESDGAEEELPPGFTEDDADLLRRVMGGASNAEIAGDLGLGEDEVAARVEALFSRAGVSSREQATAFAVRESVA